MLTLTDQLLSQTNAISIEALKDTCSKCSLQQLCLPAGISESDINRLDKIVRRRRTIPRDGRLFHINEPLHAIYVARKGAFKTVNVSEDGTEQIQGFHLPGELIGLDALGTSEHRCEAIALAPSDVCEVPYDVLAETAMQIPGLQKQLLRIIGYSMDRDQDHSRMLTKKQASERVALFIHSIAHRYQNFGHSDDSFKLVMSREDIANHLGLAFETVSRSFSRLQEDGIIQVSGRQLRILDKEALMRLANGLSE